MGPPARDLPCDAAGDSPAMPPGTPAPRGAARTSRGCAGMTSGLDPGGGRARTRGDAQSTKATAMSTALATCG
eukprot:7457129-Lingulodinium_polyedra.AAC.1